MGAARKRCERAGHLKKIKIKLETVRGGEREKDGEMLWKRERKRK